MTNEKPMMIWASGRPNVRRLLVVHHDTPGLSTNVREETVSQRAKLRNY